MKHTITLIPGDGIGPEIVEEAVKVLSGEGPSARLVAGGTDLWPNMKRRHQQAEISTTIFLMRNHILNRVD